MAGNIFIPLKAIFDNKGIKDAQAQFGNLGKSLKGILGAAGIGLSFASITQSLDAMGRAAAADAKSQGLLANAMRNSVGATDSQIMATELFIAKLQTTTSILDDNLRPAMATAIRATGDLTKAQQVLALATDVSAGTGKDLELVTKSIARALDGNTAGLQKLVPGIKKGSDVMAELTKKFDGAAVAAANLDPYARLNTVFNDLQEKIGVALLPSMNRLADFMNSDEFTRGVNSVAKDFNNLVTGFTVLGDSIDDTVKQINAGLSGLGIGVDTGGWDRFIAGLVPGYTLLRGIIALGGAKNAQDALNKGSGVNTNSLAGILKASGGAFTPTGSDYKPAGDAKALTAAQKAAAAAAKAAAAAIKVATDAANEQAEAYLKASQAAAELMSESRKLTSAMTDVFKTAPELGQFESAAVDAFTSIFDLIDSALGDGRILSDAAARLREYATSERMALQSIAKQRDVLAGKIDVARSITSGVTGLLNITGLLETTSKSVTETVTSIVNGVSLATTKTFEVVESGGLVDNFQKLVDKTKAFAKNLIDLKKLGLNKQLFAQLVQAGADAGGATAEAIVAGGSDTISALNSLYNELALSAGDIAATATDTLYEVGQQVISNGFIEGLLSQDSELQRAAQTLAEAFASTFQTQLQLAVDAVLPNQGGMIDQVAAVNLSGSGAGGAFGGRELKVASAGRATIFNVNVSAGVVTDPNMLAKTVIDSVKKYERSNGSVWVAA